MRRFWFYSVFVFLALGVFSSFAQVRVTKSAGSKSTLDWSGLAVDRTASAELFRKTLESDLLKSGWFVRGAPGRSEFTLSGRCRDSGGALKVKCQVYEVSSRRGLLSKGYSGKNKAARQLAHEAADDIIKAITGKDGLFSGRLVLVGNRTGKKELYLCGSDGLDLIQLTKDRSISLAPKWSPGGKKIYYTSYLRGYPDLYSIELRSGDRKRISGYPGLNTGGEVSPNGRDLALILSKDGNPDLYVMNLKSKRLTRVTKTPRIAEASPSWSPDGNKIVYVSDMPGTPQLYVISRDGGRPKRVTGRVAESVAPDWGENGMIVYSALVGGHYQVCVLDPVSLRSKQITSSGAVDYEDPCWAPDGRHIACGRTRRFHSSIYLLDTLGDPPIALLENKDNWYSPSWTRE